MKENYKHLGLKGRYGEDNERKYIKANNLVKVYNYYINTFDTEKQNEIFKKRIEKEITDIYK